jgi:hypothetical protein
LLSAALGSGFLHTRKIVVHLFSVKRLRID